MRFFKNVNEIKKAALCFALAALVVSANDGSLPETLTRPQKGESPRYPSDAVIGVLGRGDAPANAYALAKRTLTVFLNGSFEALSEDDKERAAAVIREVTPRVFRLGGGRLEEDGSMSFIFRFIGAERWAAGEIFVSNLPETTPEGASQSGAWRVDGIIFDESRGNGETAPVYRYDFSPYERFF